MIGVPEWLRTIAARIRTFFAREEYALRPRVSADLLVQAIRCERSAARLYADFLDDAAHRWEIDTPARLAGWLAQLAYESALFTRIEESLYYTTPARLIAVWPSRFRLPVVEREESSDVFVDGKRNARLYVRDPVRLANFVYGGRLGNGPESSGDGWLYRGRGLIQVTGRDNYRAYEQATGQSVLIEPEQLCAPFGAAHSAGWFWAENGLNTLADAQDWDGLTRRISGGTLGLAERTMIAQAAMERLT